MAKKNKRYCYITARLEGTGRNKSKSLLLLSLYSTSRSNFKQDFTKLSGRLKRCLRTFPVKLAYKIQVTQVREGVISPSCPTATHIDAPDLRSKKIIVITLIYD